MKNRAIVMNCIAYAIIYLVFTDSISNMIVRLLVAAAFGVIAATNIKCISVLFSEKKAQNSSDTQE